MHKLVSIVAGLVMFASAGFAQFGIIDPAPTPSPTPALVPGKFQSDIISTAMDEMGVYKMPGMTDARVREYVESTGNPLEMYLQDGWCSSFVSWVLKKNGYEYTPFPYMDEYLYVGIPTSDPQPGDIVMIPGHVAFFDGWVDTPGLAPHTMFKLLGGNQAHRVCIFPLVEGWVQMFLHPIKAPPGWQPRKHFGMELSSSEGLLNDKSNLMSVLNYAFHPEKDNSIPTIPSF